MAKNTIPLNTAIAQLYASANEKFDMRFDEFIQSLFGECISEVHKSADVEGYDEYGLDEEDVAWYDDTYEDFKENILAQIKEKFC